MRKAQIIVAAQALDLDDAIVERWLALDKTMPEEDLTELLMLARQCVDKA